MKLEAYMLAHLIYQAAPLNKGILINVIAGSATDNNESDIVPDIVA